MIFVSIYFHGNQKMKTKSIVISRRSEFSSFYLFIYLCIITTILLSYINVIEFQIFVAFLWVYVIIVLEAYSAKLVFFLTVKRIPEGINTIEELYYSSLPIYGNTRYYIDSLELAQNIHARVSKSINQIRIRVKKKKKTHLTVSQYNVVGYDHYQ